MSKLGATSIIILSIYTSACSVSSSGCYYDDPVAAFNKICTNVKCQTVLRVHVNSCKNQLEGKLTKNIKYKGETESVSYLTMGIMKEMVRCMSLKSGKDVSGLFDLEQNFREIDYNVRSKKFEKSVTCLNEDCTKKRTLSIRPVIGETKNLFYSF